MGLSRHNSIVAEFPSYGSGSFTYLVDDKSKTMVRLRPHEESRFRPGYRQRKIQGGTKEFQVLVEGRGYQVINPNISGGGHLDHYRGFVVMGLPGGEWRAESQSGSWKSDNVATKALARQEVDAFLKQRNPIIKTKAELEASGYGKLTDGLTRREAEAEVRKLQTERGKLIRMGSQGNYARIDIAESYRRGHTLDDRQDVVRYAVWVKPIGVPNPEGPEAEYMKEQKICRDCKKPIEYLADFPGPRCLACHAAKMDKLPLERPDFVKAIRGIRRRRNPEIVDAQPGVILMTPVLGDYPTLGEAETYTRSLREQGRDVIIVCQKGLDNSDHYFVAEGSEAVRTQLGVPLELPGDEPDDDVEIIVPDDDEEDEDEEIEIQANPKYGGGVEHFKPRFVPEDLLPALSNMWHTSRVHSNSRYERLLYTSKWFHKEHPELSETAIYKDLDNMLDFGGRNPRMSSPFGQLPPHELIHYSTGRWGFVGRVDDRLAYEPGEGKRKTRSWATKQEAIDAARELGYDAYEYGKKAENPAMLQTQGSGWIQESYETGSPEIRRRSAQLRKLGYRVMSMNLGHQITSSGGMKVTLLDIRPKPGDTYLESWPPPEYIPKEGAGHVRRGDAGTADWWSQQKNPKKSNIQVGDMVRYKAEFLRNIGVYSGPMAHAIGKVTDISPMGGPGTSMLATVDWGGADLPDRMNVGVLIRKGEREHANPDSFNHLATAWDYGFREGEASKQHDQARKNFVHEGYRKWLHLYADRHIRPQLEAEWRRGYEEGASGGYQNPETTPYDSDAGKVRPIVSRGKDKFWYIYAYAGRDAVGNIVRRPVGAGHKRKESALKVLREMPESKIGLNPFRKPVASMTAGEINRELDKLDLRSSRVTQEMIDAGRGNERPSDYRSKTDPLSVRQNEIHRAYGELRNEMERRYGPGVPHRLPKGFGPLKKLNNSSTWHAEDGEKTQPHVYQQSSGYWYIRYHGLETGPFKTKKQAEGALRRKLAMYKNNPANGSVAQTILQQLGGNRFLTMTGTHSLISSADALSMHLRRNRSGASYLRVTLKPDDTYTMSFTRSRGTKLIPVKTLDGVYADQLQELFTEVTGLYTKLNNPDRNPEDGFHEGDAAADLSEEFHGRESGDVIEVEEREHYRSDLAILGDLVELIINTPTGYEATITFNYASNEFPVKLCSSADRRQLYIEGGDQDIDELLGKWKMDGNKWIKDLMVLGDWVEVTYRTEKGFDKFKLIDYYHNLGEETDIQPVVLYDHLNKKLTVAGGNYDVQRDGLIN